MNRLNFIKYAEMLEEQPKLESKALLAFRYLFKRVEKRDHRGRPRHPSGLSWRERNMEHYLSWHRQANREYYWKRKAQGAALELWPRRGDLDGSILEMQIRLT